MRAEGRAEPGRPGRMTRQPRLQRWMPRARGRAAGPLMAAVLVAAVMVLLGCDGNLTIATGGGGSPAATSGPHAIWQVGVQAPPSDAHAIALHVRMQTRLPQKVAANTTNYFWVGSYLGDGSFIQVGYYVPWYQSEQAGWFYCAFADPQGSGDCHDGALGTVDGGSSWHSYGLEAAPDAGGSGAPGWAVTFDGQDVGSFAWPSQDTGPHAPTIFAESSGTTPRATPGDQLGPVDFSQFSVVPAGQRDEQTITAGLPSYNAPNVCPPFGIRPDGHGGVLLGSGLSCPTALDVVSWG